MGCADPQSPVSENPTPGVAGVGFLFYAGCTHPGEDVQFHQTGRGHRGEWATPRRPAAGLFFLVTSSHSPLSTKPVGRSRLVRATPRMFPLPETLVGNETVV